jgi:hypothetical protein
MRTFRLKPFKPPPLTENDVERACIDLLHYRGYWVGRLHAGTFKTADGLRWIHGFEKGTPDYAVMHELFPGFMLEVKRPGAFPTPEQDRKHFELHLAYRLAICVVDGPEALRAWLDQHERGRKKQ